MPIIKAHSKFLVASIFFGFGPGCGGTQQSDTAPPITIAAASPSAGQPIETPGPAETTREETPPAPLISSRCAPDGAFPAVAPEPKSAAPLPCRPAEVSAEKTITSDLKARYHVMKDKSTAEVKFGCDALDKVLARIVLESGGGHNGALEIIEISRSDSSSVSFDVMGVRLSPSMMGRPRIPFEIMRSTLSQEAVYAVTPLVRAALRATIEEVEAKPDPNARTGSGSVFGSSSDFHLRVRIEDPSARVMEKHYTGYENSFGQAQYLPLRRIREELDRALAGSNWQSAAPSEEIKFFFDRRFVEAREHFSDSLAGWVRERYVKLVPHVGTRALVPYLLPLLTPAGNNASNTRTREYAFEALVALTAWDPRAPKNGEPPRSIEAAANDFVVECGKVPSKR